MRVERGERRRSERKDVNPFLVSLQPISPFLLIAGVLLSAGELPTLSLSLSNPLPLHLSLSLQRFSHFFHLPIFSLSNLLSAILFVVPGRLCATRFSLSRSLVPSSLHFYRTPSFSRQQSLAPVRFLILPSRRGENKNYESARHLSRATARSRGFTRPCSRASRHVSTIAKMFNPCVVRHETTTSGFLKYFEPMVSIFSRILDSQLYQTPITIIGLQVSHENLVSYNVIEPNS